MPAMMNGTLSHWPMLRNMVASKSTWSFLTYSMRKRDRKMPISPTPNSRPG